ncbi:MAG: hypothetical protein EAZ53_09290 [Bacteroidetes bacterium]|nr:MAG: hypothetical protein EAZ53_09290 [Bacteroidota bacterium]
MKPIKYTVFSIILLNAIFLNGQPKKLTDIVDSIVKINELQEEHIGMEGRESENYKNFKLLKEIASIEELMLLVENKNAVVACYASWALVEKSYPNLMEIFRKFILQDKIVQTYSGCIKSQYYISCELYFRYLNKIGDFKKSTDKILYQFDSITLFSPKPHRMLINAALQNRVYQQPCVTQISKLAFEQCNKEAIFYLSKWNKEDYSKNIKDAIIQYLNQTTFKTLGTKEYYAALQELIKYKDYEVNKAIIFKMKNDRSWEKSKVGFLNLLKSNNIDISEIEKKTY